MNINDLLAYKIDDIPNYILKRDVLRIDTSSQEMIEVKNKILQHDHVKKVTNIQWDDGSWGRFHSMSTTGSINLYTTEKAMRRLQNLGLDKNDTPIKKVISYMETYMKNEIQLRDYIEKKHDWYLLTRLFVSTWILRFDNENALALEEARKWAKVITHAFSQGIFNETLYKDAYIEYLNPEPNKFVWQIENFYIVSILRGLLDNDTESRFINHLINSNKGIYYIYSNNLMIPPKEFQSRESNRFLMAWQLILDFKQGRKHSSILKNWINNSRGEDGFWDNGSIAKDNLLYPLSDSWRKKINRKIDCTIRILKMVNLMDL